LPHWEARVLIAGIIQSGFLAIHVEPNIHHAYIVVFQHIHVTLAKTTKFI